MKTNTNKHTQKQTNINIHTHKYTRININIHRHKHTYKLRKIKPSYRLEKIVN